MCVRSEMRAVQLHSIFVLIISFQLGFGLNAELVSAAVFLVTVEAQIHTA